MALEEAKARDCLGGYNRGFRTIRKFWPENEQTRSFLKTSKPLCEHNSHFFFKSPNPQKLEKPELARPALQS